MVFHVCVACFRIYVNSSCPLYVLCVLCTHMSIIVVSVCAMWSAIPSVTAVCASLGVYERCPCACVWFCCLYTHICFDRSYTSAAQGSLRPSTYNQTRRGTKRERAAVVLRQRSDPMGSGRRGTHARETSPQTSFPPSTWLICMSAGLVFSMFPHFGVVGP